MKKNLLPIIILSVLIACNKDDGNEPVVRPEVQTLEAMVGGDGGVTFSANVITNGQEVTEHGFDYALDSLFTAGKETIALGSLSSDGQYSYLLETGLIEAEKYFYRAYTTSNNEMQFGDPGVVSHHRNLFGLIL